MQNNNKTSRVNLLFPFFKFRAESICCSVERTLLVTFMSSNLSVDRVYHPGLDRHGAVDVSGDLDVPRGLPRAQGGRRTRTWNLTPHSGVWFFTNLPSGIRKSAPRRLDLDFLDSSSSLTLFGPLTSPHPFLAVQPLAVSAPFTVPHRSDLPDQRPKTKSPSPHSLLPFIVSPLSIRVIIIFGGKRRVHDDRIIDKTCIFF
jgi:hypothetical protein